MAANAVELANAYLTLIPSMKGSQARITQELVPQAEAAGDSAGKKSASKFGAAFAGIAAKATAVGSAIAVGLTIKGGISRALNIEDAKAKLTGLGHSGESVAAIMKNASASVKGTAFGLAEAASTAAGAVAAGVKPGAELERTLKLTGDAATIAGSSMGEMGSIFNKVATSNKVQGDVLAQLGDRGIPIVQLLAKEMGVSASEVTKLASKGKIDFATFQNAMEKGMGGAALKSGETTRGAIKNMGAAFARLGEKIIVPLLPKFNELVGGVTKFADAATAWAGPALDALIQWFGKLLESGKKFYNEFLKPIMPDLSGLGGQLKDVGTAIQDGAGPAMDRLGEAVWNAGVFVRDSVGWLRDHKNEVSFAAAAITTVMLPALVRLGVESTISAAKSVAAWILSSTAGARAAATYVVTSFVVVGRWIAMGAAAIASGAQTVAIWALYAAEAIKGAAAFVVQVARVVGGWILMGAQAVISGAVTAAVWVGTVVASAVSGAASFVVQVARVVGGWVLMGVQAMLQAARMAAAWFIALGPVGWVIAAVVGLVALIVANWDKVSKATAAAWGAVSSWLTGVWKGIVSIATSVWNGLVSFVMGIPGRFMAGLAYLGQLAGVIGGYVSGAKDAAVGRFLDLVGWVGGLPGRILGALGNLGSLLLNAGGQIMAGFLRGLKDAFKGVQDFVGGIGQWIADHKGPKAYDLALLVPAGGWIMQGLGSGLEGGLPRLRRTLADVAGEVTAAIAPASSSLDIAAGLTGAGPEFSGQGGPLVAVYPQPGMSEQTIGRVAADSLNTRIRRSR
ncbi:tape measure protein [Arthrobacter phage Galaxy]|uniref:Tape measure protein n=1 Tax=Arthrobacter phage Galaxy TaxID=1772326 RepID=A0A0U4B2G9_9CAUD|nr:tail length tape measure protein [Arthrobacter phage Galaxy]ALY08862.1 tape measure protein [Arthrobacter phage Galaxy]